MNKFIKWLLSFLLTLGLLAAVFWKTEFSQVLNYIKQAQPFPLLIALAISFFTNCWLATHKWKLILKCLGLSISFREAFLIKMGCLPLKSVLPFRAGEASRVLYLKREYNFSVVKSTASILIELAANVGVFILIILMGGLIFHLNPGGVLYIIALGTGILVFVTLTASRTFTKRELKILLNKIPYPKIRGGLETLFTIHRHYSYPQIAVILLYSLIIQSGKLLTFYLINLSFNLTLPVSAYLVLLPLSVLISTIPVTFLGLGLREYSLKELILHYSVAAVAVDKLVLVALFFSAVEYIFPVLIGIFWSRKFMAKIFLLEKF